MRIERFKIDIPQLDVDALRRRLADTRWAPELDNADWAYGVNGTYLRELTAYRERDFDWRAQERQINAFPHFRTEIDSTPIHFIHVQGKGPNPTPIILNHGWPWTFWDFKDVILPLADPVAHGGDPADAFHVVVPSLPGFCFSGPLARSEIGYVQTADMWVKLMQGLGYERFVTQGGDAGAFISAQLGHAYPESIIGVHSTFPILPGVANDAGLPANPSPRERALAAEDFARARTAQVHLMVHNFDPQTLAWALHDSPVGLAAWLLIRRRDWSDCDGEVERQFDRDTLLTHFSLYWFTNSFVGSELFCRASGFPEPPKLVNDIKPEIGVPTAIAIMPKDLMHRPRSVVAAHTDLRRWTELATGGHFAPAEQPQALVADIRAFVRSLR